MLVRCHLIVKPALLGSVLIFVRKQLFCGTSSQQRAGVLATAHLLRSSSLNNDEIHRLISVYTSYYFVLDCL